MIAIDPMRYKFTLRQADQSWVMTTHIPSNGHTIDIVFCNDGTGSAYVKLIRAYDHGDDIILLTDNAFRDAMKEQSLTNGTWSMERYSTIFDLDVDKLVNDAITAWHALNAITELSL